MGEKIKNIIKTMETLASKHYAMKWDNVGLQVGSKEAEVRKVIVCLDVTKEVMKEAIENKADMIIAHHPVIFSPLKSVVKEDYKGNLIHEAIKNDIHIYSAHTNMDIAKDGLNDYIVDKLALENPDILDITDREKLYKIVVFVPKGHEEKVADGLAEAGAGHIGNYSHCSFRIEGTGTFKPQEGTNPFIGKQGELEKVEEIRLETIVPQSRLAQSIEKMTAAHPYEEVAYDIFPLNNLGEKRGIGRIATLPSSKVLSDFAKGIKEIFQLKAVKVTGDITEEVKKIAVVNGSGADYIQLAAARGCDCLVTGDVKYHEAQTALELGIKVIDAGHFETEMFFTDLVVNYLKGQNLNIEVIASQTKINPFNIL